MGEGRGGGYRLDKGRLASTLRVALRVTPLSWMVVTPAAVVRAYTFAASPTVRYPDTDVYFDIARRPFTDAHWLVGGRPPTTSLLYLLAGNTADGAVHAQWLLGLVCWSVLAVVVARLVDTPWLKPVAAGVVLLFSLSREVTLWDRVMLSESVSLSLLALLVAALLLYVERPDRGRLATVLGVTAFWVLARDANAYAALMMAGVFAMATLAARRLRSPHAIAAAGCLVVFGLSFVTSNAALRWEYPFYNVVAYRILEDPAATDYFVAHGMPMNDALLEHRGRGGEANFEYTTDPRLRAVHDWVRENAKGVYASFLATHPRFAFLAPWSAPVKLLSDVQNLRVHAPGAWTPFAGMLSAWTFPDADVPGFVLVNAVGFAAACGLTLGWRRRWLVPALMVVLALPLSLLIYHADAVGVGRHELVPMAQLRLGLWLLALLAADALATSRARPRTASTGSASS